MDDTKAIYQDYVRISDSSMTVHHLIHQCDVTDAFLLSWLQIVSNMTTHAQQPHHHSVQIQEYFEGYILSVITKCMYIYTVRRYFLVSYSSIGIPGKQTRVHMHEKQELQTQSC